ncbi:hypothetical protein ABID29_001783 [Streptococcus rupicaprae]|uniref:Phage protein n=1 Tax=Streptococcus rupicaprae TaxID=759619 RepID=A0ABV2FJF5_9STRE
MYVISIYIINNDKQSECFGMIGTDFCPAGETDLKAESFSTKEEAVSYLKSAGYEPDGIYYNRWRATILDGELTSICKIWKVV